MAKKTKRPVRRPRVKSSSDSVQNTQLKEEMNNRKVQQCIYEHPPVWGKKQDVQMRTMHNKQDGNRAFYCQCSICGATGPAASSPDKAAKRWNMRKVMVYERSEFEKIKEELNTKESETESK